MAGERGYSLIEMMVALTLFGIIAVAVGETVVWSQRTRQLSENWMHATQLAEDGIEAVRSGQWLEGPDDLGIFRREIRVDPVAGHHRLARVDVVVTWTDSRPQQFALSTMVRQ